MPWKKDNAGHLAVDEKGNPVFVQDGDGAEKPVDYAELQAKWQELSKGEQKYRKRVSELEKSLEPLKGVSDFAAYAKEHGELQEANERLRENTDAAKIEERIQANKAAIEKAWLDKEKGWKAQLEGKSAELAAEREKRERLMGDMRSEKVRALFNESAYAREKCALPATILNKLFGDEATIAEDGSFNGYSPGSKDVMRDTDGKPASFENWIARQVSSHLEGKTMLKGSPIAAPGGTGQTAPGGSANPWAKGAENYTEQNKLIASNPELAKLMAATAGAKLPF